MQNRSDMNISTLLTSLYLRKAETGPPGGRGQAVFGTCLATGEHSRWERYDVLGEIKPERMPQWAKDALKTIQKAQPVKAAKQKEMER